MLSKRPLQAGVLLFQTRPRMSREMSGGRKVYLFKPGRQALREDLIDVFDPATYDEVGTVAEQRSNYEAWIRSLK